MNGVLAHEAKEVDIVKLAGLVARKMVEITATKIANITKGLSMTMKKKRIVVTRRKTLLPSLPV